MSWSMKKYKESLKNTGKPIRMEDIKKGMKYKELFEYAKKKGVRVSELTDEEKNMFVFDID